jgi:hypothetical protein
MQLIRGMCDTPAASLPTASGFAMQNAIAGIQRANRRPEVLGGSAAQLLRYGVVPQRVLSLTTMQDAHTLTTPPTTTWPIRYVIWMSRFG